MADFVSGYPRKSLKSFKKKSCIDFTKFKALKRSQILPVLRKRSLKGLKIVLHQNLDKSKNVTYQKLLWIIDF